MFNIAHFQQQIQDEFSPAYKTYNTMYMQNMLLCPIIYTDNYNRIINMRIPIFSTFYIREHFSKDKYILIDYIDYEYIPKYLRNNCIVIYNELFHDVAKITESFLTIELEQNSIDLIKEKLQSVTIS